MQRYDDVGSRLEMTSLCLKPRLHQHTDCSDGILQGSAICQLPVEAGQLPLAY